MAALHRSSIAKRDESRLESKLSVIPGGSGAQISFREQLQCNHGLGLRVLVCGDGNPLEPKHTIFLSHSGAQKSFVEQLCLDIETRDRYPFFDKRRDSLSIGCHFPNEILKAIKQCHVAVVVLSEEFFSRSKWPMLELAALVKRKAHDPKLTIMPVFLGITHAECGEKEKRDCWLTLWRGWAKRDKRIVVEDWEVVFKVFGYTNSIFLSGYDEVGCRQEIVKSICKEVPPETRRDDSYIQGRSRLCKVIREKIDGMRLSKCYGVRILGLYGVGGIGKSTACKALCNDYFKYFEGRVCHVEFGDGNELLMLQEVLKRLTDTKHEFIEKLNEDECKEMMKRTIKGQRVFWAIDNVYESRGIIKRAKEFLKVGFERGSIVVVTARSLGVFQHLNIDGSECIEMPELVEDDAISLFLNHAFPDLHLKNSDFVNDELVRQCIKRCHFGKGDGTSYHYHPLALEVLGGELGIDPTEWREKLTEIDVFNQYRERDKMHPVFSILRRSFDTLQDEDKLLFMDAALSYSAPMYRTRVDLFDWLSMIHGTTVGIVTSRLNGLKRKSLIQDLGDGSTRVGIHDLWREFCVMETKAGELKSRRWVYQEVIASDDLRRAESSLCVSGWKELQRIWLRGHWLNPYKWNVNLKLNCCSSLTVLQLVGVYVEDEVLDLSGVYNLKSLELSRCRDVKVLGLGLLRHLVVLEWSPIPRNSPCIEEIGGLTNLQVLTLICGFGDSNKLPDLTRLNLLQRTTFESFSEGVSISCSSTVTNLRYLELSWCRSLRSCNGVGDLVALEELNINRCENLEGLPNLQHLKNLQKLDIFGCRSLKTLSGTGDLVALLELRVSECQNLAELPDMRKLTNLQVLNLSRCPLNTAVTCLSDLINLQRLWISINGMGDSADLHKLTKLLYVSIEGWSPQGSPGVDSLANLEHLRVVKCRGVDELAGLSKLTRLCAIGIEDCEFKDVSCLSNLIGLQDVTIMKCRLLERFPDMHKATGLKRVEIGRCVRLRELGGVSGTRSGSSEALGVHLQSGGGTLPKLQVLRLWKVAITELPDLSSFPQLNDLNISKCRSLMGLTCTAPLTALECLDLRDCRSLTALPDLSGSKHLRRVRVTNCGVELSAHEIEKLKAMCPTIDIDT